MSACAKGPMAAMLPILVLGNDDFARRRLVATLTDAGFREVSGARRPPAGGLPPGIAAGDGALVVLDLGPEPADGLDWCRAVRRARPALLICAVTRRPDPALESVALEQGADAVVPWPHDPRRLGAQLQALLRPLRATTADTDLALDPLRRCALVEGRRLALTDAEFDLLRELHRRRGQVVSRDALSQALYGRPCGAGDRSLDLRVARLRRKLGDDARAPRFIRAVRGEGYLLMAAVR